MADLIDTVELDPGVSPADVEEVLIEQVNLAWRTGGPDARCDVSATFLAFILQERKSLIGGAPPDRAKVFSALRQLEEHSPTWVAAIRAYIIKIERQRK